MTKETIAEIRILFNAHAGGTGKAWDDFPDHMIDFYARSYLANTHNQKYRWWRDLCDLITDDVLLSETNDV